MSRWASVALAARCARLALPYFAQLPLHLNARHFEALTQAVAAVEASAASGAPAAELNELFYKVVSARGAARRAVYDRPAGQPPTPQEERAVEAAEHITTSVECAIESARAQIGLLATASAQRAHLQASMMCDVIGNAALEKQLDDEHRHILRLCERELWTDDTPVPVSVFEKKNRPWFWPRWNPRGRR